MHSARPPQLQLLKPSALFDRRTRRRKLVVIGTRCRCRTSTSQSRRGRRAQKTTRAEVEASKGEVVALVTSLHKTMQKNTVVVCVRVETSTETKRQGLRRQAPRLRKTYVRCGAESKTPKGLARVAMSACGRVCECGRVRGCRSTAVGVIAIGTAVLVALQASRALTDRARNADDAKRSTRRAVRCRREQGLHQSQPTTSRMGHAGNAGTAKPGALFLP